MAKKGCLVTQRKPVSSVLTDLCHQGSLYKLICRELILFLVVYALLGVIYRQLMNESQQKFVSNMFYPDPYLTILVTGCLKA